MPTTTKNREREDLPLYPSAKQLLGRWGRDHLYLHWLLSKEYLHAYTRRGEKILDAATLKRGRSVSYQYVVDYVGGTIEEFRYRVRRYVDATGICDPSLVEEGLLDDSDVQAWAKTEYDNQPSKTTGCARKHRLHKGEWRIFEIILRIVSWSKFAGCHISNRPIL
jgi:hypothetical protein